MKRRLKRQYKRLLFVLIILAIFAGGLLFGMTGIILALPFSIIVVTTIKYFKSDITDMIDDIKEDKKVKNRHSL